MWVRRSPDKQQQHVPESLKEFENFLNKNGDKKKIEKAKKIFYETYLENIQGGMSPEEALQKAKSVALCFLFVQ